MNNGKKTELWRCKDLAGTGVQDISHLSSVFNAPERETNARN